MSTEEYCKIVIINTPDRYEIDAKKINKNDSIQCPHDLDTYISGVQDDGSVTCQIPGGKIEQGSRYWKTEAIKAKENTVRIQTAYNDISKDVDNIHSKQAIHRT